jgi:hypothetical protein
MKEIIAVSNNDENDSSFIAVAGFTTIEDRVQTQYTLWIFTAKIEHPLLS